MTARMRARRRRAPGWPPFVRCRAGLEALAAAARVAQEETGTSPRGGKVGPHVPGESLHQCFRRCAGRACGCRTVCCPRPAPRPRPGGSRGPTRRCCRGFSGRPPRSPAWAGLQAFRIRSIAAIGSRGFMRAMTIAAWTSGDGVVGRLCNGAAAWTGRDLRIAERAARAVGVEDSFMVRGPRWVTVGLFQQEAPRGPRRAELRSSGCAASARQHRNASGREVFQVGTARGWQDRRAVSGPAEGLHDDRARGVSSASISTRRGLQRAVVSTAASAASSAITRLRSAVVAGPSATASATRTGSRIASAATLSQKSCSAPTSIPAPRGPRHPVQPGSRPADQHRHVGHDEARHGHVVLHLQQVGGGIWSLPVRPSRRRCAPSSPRTRWRGPASGITKPSRLAIMCSQIGAALSGRSRAPRCRSRRRSLAHHGLEIAAPAHGVVVGLRLDPPRFLW